MKKHLTLEFKIASEDSYSVTIIAWNRKEALDQWHWNVYAHIYDKHPLFDNPENAVETLPFHCGATYDKIITTEPAQGIKYDWQRINKTLKIGSDYAHIYDNYDNHPSPFEGIPSGIEADALELIGALECKKKVTG